MQLSISIAYKAAIRCSIISNLASPDATWNRQHLAIIGALQDRDAAALRREMLRDIGWGAEHYAR